MAAQSRQTRLGDVQVSNGGDTQASNKDETQIPMKTKHKRPMRAAHKRQWRRHTGVLARRGFRRGFHGAAPMQPLTPSHRCNRHVHPAATATATIHRRRRRQSAVCRLRTRQAGRARQAAGSATRGSMQGGGGLPKPPSWPPAARVRGCSSRGGGLNDGAASPPPDPPERSWRTREGSTRRRNSIRRP